MIPEKNGFFQNLWKRPGWALALFVAFSVILWTLQCSLTQNILPLDVIETIVWGRQGQWGHFRHPPLSGWIGYGFSRLSGGADWSLYLAAQLCLACGVFYVYKLGRKLLTEYEAAAGALLLYILFYYTPSSMKFCSHFTLTALMPAMAYHFYCGIEENRWRDWLLLGLFSGLACLGKYSAVQLFPAFLVIMLLTPTGHRRLRQPGVYVSAVIFFLVLAPHVQWLMEHDYGPLRHLTERVEDTKEPWYLPLEALGTLLYPFFLAMIPLALALMPWKKTNRIVRKITWYPVTVFLLLALVPGMVFVVIAATGGNVILMWFSFLASWTGLVVVALCPWQIDQNVFRRLWCWLMVYVCCMFFAVTIDVLCKSRLRCHTRPEEFTVPAEAFFKERSGGKPIPVVFGSRWAAGVIENYLPYHPKACVEDDPCNLELVREDIRTKGLLVFTDNRSEMQKFFKALGRSAPIGREVTVHYKAPFGKEDTDRYYLAYLPPETEEPAQK